MFNLYINNFRSFKNQNFNFSKINILIGENSGGKSSLLKFFLLLKQSIRNPFEANLSFEGFTDLGNFQEVVYYHRDNQSIMFEFEFADIQNYYDFFLKVILPDKTDNKDLYKKTKNKIDKIIGGKDITPIKLRYEIDKDIDSVTSLNTKITSDFFGSITIRPIEKKLRPGQNPTCDILHINKEGKQETYTNIQFEKEAFMTMVVPTTLKSRLEETFENEEVIDNYFFNFAFLLISQNYLANLLETMEFINPVESKPLRFYYMRDKKTSYTNNDLEKMINILSNIKLEEDETMFLEQFNKILSAYGLASELKILKDDRVNVIELQVKIKDLISNISDVGYGVSLQLPILFQAYLRKLSRDFQTLLIEQPEVHLHPKLQAQFIETLININESNRFFIETHSEHIVRKLQVMVKEKKLSQNDITIHYFKRENEKSVITEHKILENGFLNKPFPDGFFDSSYNLSMDLIK